MSKANDQVVNPTQDQFREAYYAEVARNGYVEMPSLRERFRELGEPVLDELQAELDLYGLLHGAFADPPADGPETLVLQSFGRYQIDPDARKQLLGWGGLNSIHRATDTLSGFDRPLAIKIPLARLVNDRGVCEYLRREARITARLQHPNIVPVYEAGDYQGRCPFFSMKVVEGSTLLARLAARTRPSEGLQDLLGAFRQVCGAVAYAHSSRVIHGDLKPDNVMVGRFGEVQVMDWGFARELGDRVEEVPSRIRSLLRASCRVGTGSVFGTEAYMSPEQAEPNAHAYSDKTDVFGLGGILCHILTGCPVYVGLPMDELRALAKRGDTGDAVARLQKSEADSELIRLAEACLAVDPAKRPTAAAVESGVKAHLERIQEARVRAERRAKWAVFAVLLLTLVSGALGSLIYWQHARQKEDARKQEEERQTSTRAAEVAAAVAEMYRELDRDQFGPAAAALRQARGRLGLDPPTELANAVADAQKHYTVAVTLDEIRQESAVLPFFPNLSQNQILARYAEQFALLGCSPDLADAGERIRMSPIRLHLIAALDSWALAARKLPEQMQILAVALKAEPDPVWGDRFRNPAIRADPQGLLALVNEIGVEKLTLSQLASVLELCGNTMKQSEIMRFLGVAEARRPSEFWVHLISAVTLSQTNHFDIEQNRTAWGAARMHARVVVALRPESPFALAFAAKLALRSGDAQELEWYVERLERHSYAGWLKYHVLAMAAVKRQDYQKALGYIDQAIALNPDVNEKIVRVEILLFLGNIQAAIAESEIIIDAHPELSNAWAYKGNLLLVTKRFDEAEHHFRQALKLDQSNGIAWTGFATGLGLQGRFLDAEACLRKAGSDGAQINVQANMVSALIMAERGNYDDAIRILNQIERTLPNWEADFVSANVLLNAGRIDEARVSLDRFRNRTKDLPVIRSSLAGLDNFHLWEMYFHLNNFGKAERSTREKLPVGLENAPRILTSQPSIVLGYADCWLVLRFNHTAARCYELGLPGNSEHGSKSYAMLLGTNRFRAARAATQVWVGNGRDVFRATDEERNRFRKLALNWVKEEVDDAQRAVANNTDLVPANKNLHRLVMHRDLDPLRNPLLIREMPEEDQKLAKETWARVDKLLAKLNPRLDIPGLDKK